jgi:hypothetical protein
MPVSPARLRASGPRVFAALILALLAAPASAPALGIGELEPLYFDGPGGQGFAADDVAAIGRAAEFSAGSTGWLAVGATGSASALGLTQVLGTEHQNPGAPSFADPVIADSSWTVRNQTAGTLIAPLLVFTSVDPLDRYPIALPPTGLDADLLSLLAYSFAGTDYLYGAIRLPDLAPGASTVVTVRYVVAGALAGGDTLPPLGVAGLTSYVVVPEPSSAALLGTGVLWIAVAARRRRARA